MELEAPNTKWLGPSKRKVMTITPGSKTPNNKKQHCDISNANLNARLKQLSAKNANDSLLHDPIEDNETKRERERVTKYFTMPLLGKYPSVWWEGFAQLMQSKHPKLFTEYILCLSCSKSSKNPDLGLVKIGICQSTSNL